jgi:hypothetical protein
VGWELEETLEKAGTEEGERKGRPAGSKNKKIGFRNWQPKKWKVDYEMMVLMHVSGKSNKEIAESLDFSEVQVGNVLLCDEAQKRLDEIKGRLHNRGKTIEEKLVYIMEKSTDRVVEFIDNDMTFEKSPISSVTKAMQCMEMIDVRLRTGSKGDSTTNNLILATETNLDRLLGAMHNSQKAKELNAGEFTISTVGSGIGAETITK